MSNKEEVKEFYDHYVSKQERTGINSRHLSILDKLIKAGLKPNHNVLEVGCGIGTVSQLIARKTPNGSVLSVDISERSIGRARALWKDYPNLEFEVSDMSDFNKLGRTFDFFVFPDVLEHIPVEQHFALFEKVKKHSNPDSKVFIHIPAPRFLEYNIRKEPDKLQIIDQPLDTSDLLAAWRDNGFFLAKMETYSVFYKEKDYQYFILGKNVPIDKSTLRKKWPVLIERILIRAKNWIF